MPKNLLYKYKCKELLCNKIVRSDKWNDHCKKFHKIKFLRGDLVKKEIISIRDNENSPWRDWKTSSSVSSSSELQSESESTESHKQEGSASSIILTQNEDDYVMEELQIEMPQTTASEISNPDGDTTASNVDHSSPILVPIEIHAEEYNTGSIENVDAVAMGEVQPQTQILCSAQEVDPADYASKKMSAEIINMLIRKRNDLQIGLQDKLYNWKYQTLPDGSKTLRSWLVHSAKKEAIFCLPCLIFGSPNCTKRNAKYFAVDGYLLFNIHNASRDIDTHETSDYHRESELALIRWNAGKNRIDRKMIETHNYWVDHHRAVVSVIIDCIRFLTTEMLGFRNTNLKGKLINLFRLLAKYNADAKVYLEKLDKLHAEGKKPRVNFLAYSSMFKLVSIIRDMVLEEICKRITTAKYFSMIADGTQDSSKMESIVVLVRYIEGFGDFSSVSPLFTPVERLLGIFTSGETSGEVLYNNTMAVFKKYNLNINNLVGQSYDGAGNMRGCTKGMKTLVQNVCPQAIYVWCHGHRFNLVIEKTIENCGSVRKFFGILEELYLLMRSHRSHGLFVQILNENQSKVEGKQLLGRRRLKRVLTTRWNSKHSSCTTLVSCYESVIQCLDLISKDKNSKKETISSAAGLRVKLSTFDFFATLKICVAVFDILAPTTTMLQGTIMDFGSSTAVIENTVQKLRGLRTEKSWKKLEEDIIKVTSNLGIKEKEKRTIFRKRFMDENNFDEPRLPTSTLDRFKIDIYFLVIDALILQINERFNENTLQIMKEMLIFTHENLLKNDSQTTAINLCENYHIDPIAVENELINFKKLYEVMEKEIDVSDLINPLMKERNSPKGTVDAARDAQKVTEGTLSVVEEDNEEEEQLGDGEEEDEEQEFEQEHEINELFILRGFIKPYRLLMQLSTFNNLTVLYKILVTLAVNSCSAERAFSKEKIIKSPIRSSMMDEWLSAMMVLASENDILNSLDNDKIIDRFGEKSSVYCRLLRK